MVDTGIFCTQAMMLQLAGAGVSSTISGDATFAYSNNFIRRAENFINVTSGYNWSTGYASLPTTTKYLLEEAAACLSAVMAINYDMSNYNSLAEAQTMINVLYDRAAKNITLLTKDGNKQTFVSAGA